MSRNRYDPGLPGGGRVRYVGEDAYAAQQRENETRVSSTPAGAFFAPAWSNQTPPGGLTNWYVDFGTGQPNQEPPALVTSDAHQELGCRYWRNATLEQFTFLDQANTFTGWLPVLEPGWWTLSVVTRIAGAALTNSDAAIILVPADVLRTVGVQQYLRTLNGQGVFTAAIGITGIPITIPLARRSAVLVNYEASAVPTLQGAVTAAGGTSLLFNSFVSGSQTL